MSEISSVSAFLSKKSVTSEMEAMTWDKMSRGEKPLDSVSSTAESSIREIEDEIKKMNLIYSQMNMLGSSQIRNIAQAAKGSLDLANKSNEQIQGGAATTENVLGALNQPLNNSFNAIKSAYSPNNGSASTTSAPNFLKTLENSQVTMTNANGQIPSIANNGQMVQTLSSTLTNGSGAQIMINGVTINLSTAGSGTATNNVWTFAGTTPTLRAQAFVTAASAGLIPGLTGLQFAYNAANSTTGIDDITVTSPTIGNSGQMSIIGDVTVSGLNNVLNFTIANSGPVTITDGTNAVTFTFAAGTDGALTAISNNINVGYTTTGYDTAANMATAIKAFFSGAPIGGTTTPNMTALITSINTTANISGASIIVNTNPVTVSMPIPNGNAAPSGFQVNGNSITPTSTPSGTPLSFTVPATADVNGFKIAFGTNNQSVTFQFAASGSGSGTSGNVGGYDVTSNTITIQWDVANNKTVANLALGIKNFFAQQLSPNAIGNFAALYNLTREWGANNNTIDLSGAIVNIYGVNFNASLQTGLANATTLTPTNAIANLPTVNGTPTIGSKLNRASVGWGVKSSTSNNMFDLTNQGARGSVSFPITTVNGNIVDGTTVNIGEGQTITLLLNPDPTQTNQLAISPGNMLNTLQALCQFLNQSQDPYAARFIFSVNEGTTPTITAQTLANTSMYNGMQITMTPPNANPSSYTVVNGSNGSVNTTLLNPDSLVFASNSTVTFSASPSTITTVNGSTFIDMVMTVQGANGSVETFTAKAMPTAPTANTKVRFVSNTSNQMLEMNVLANVGGFVASASSLPAALAQINNNFKSFSFYSVAEILNLNTISSGQMTGATVLMNTPSAGSPIGFTGVSVTGFQNNTSSVNNNVIAGTIQLVTNDNEVYQFQITTTPGSANNRTYYGPCSQITAVSQTDANKYITIILDNNSSVDFTSSDSMRLFAESLKKAFVVGSGGVQVGGNNVYISSLDPNIIKTSLGLASDQSFNITTQAELANFITQMTSYIAIVNNALIEVNGNLKIIFDSISAKKSESSVLKVFTNQYSSVDFNQEAVNLQKLIGTGKVLSVAIEQTIMEEMKMIQMAMDQLKSTSQVIR